MKFNNIDRITIIISSNGKVFHKETVLKSKKIVHPMNLSLYFKTAYYFININIIYSII